MDHCVVVEDPKVGVEKILSRHASAEEAEAACDLAAREEYDRLVRECRDPDAARDCLRLTGREISWAAPGAEEPLWREVFGVALRAPRPRVWGRV